MSRQNPQRRLAILDAAIEVLAREGARGLTFRAVDSEAAVPTGTTSNYFANRDVLITQVSTRTRERLAPSPGEARPPSQAELVRLMIDLRDRMRADRSSYLAMLELRLEATRRPELHAALTESFRADLAHGIQYHLDSGLPGDEHWVVLTYLAMTGLIIEDLTFPGVLAAYDPDALIKELVTRLLPL